MLNLRHVYPVRAGWLAAVPAAPGTPGALLPAYSDGHMDWGDGGFVVMWITMAVFWVGVLAVAAWAVAVYARKGSEPGRPALDIARARYARGEITTEEFERIKDSLR